MALRIGLTGGIGSGKSTLARLFEVLGIPVYNADEEARRIMNTDEALKKSICENFGAESYKDGLLNRSYLASLAFNDPAKLALLNSLVHPVTMKNGEQWMKQQTTAYVIYEAALLFEAGVQKNLDYVIGVSAPLELRIKRTMERDHTSREEVLKRMNRQLDEQEKISRCDFVIINDEHQLLIPQVLELHKKILAFADTATTQQEN